MSVLAEGIVVIFFKLQLGGDGLEKVTDDLHGGQQVGGDEEQAEETASAEVTDESVDEAWQQ